MQINDNVHIIISIIIIVVIDNIMYDNCNDMRGPSPAGAARLTLDWPAMWAEQMWSE